MDSESSRGCSPSHSESTDSGMNILFKEDPEDMEHRKPTSPGHLTFSIDNILRPDFGCKIKQERFSPRPYFDHRNHINEKQRDLDREDAGNGMLPAWIYCTRYSDRPSSGPRARRTKRRDRKQEEKRPRTAFTQDQLDRLKNEFQENRYLTEKRRQDLSKELQLNESQIKIWFQNKRAKLKKATGVRNPLVLSLMAQGLYNPNSSRKQDSCE